MFLDTNGAKLFVTRSGSMQGTTILAIGGWIGSSELWQEPLAMLSDSFTTVSYDHRGSGLTIADTATITFDNLINDAVAVLEANNIRQCVLVAESAGAQTALAVAARRADRVSHLVIVDGMYSRGLTTQDDPFLQGLRANYPATIERFVQLCISEIDAEHIKSWGRKILSRAVPEAAIALRIIGSETDVSGDIQRVQQPVLVIHGELDNIVPIEHGRALAAALPNAQFVMLAGAGHVPTLTQPDKIATLIRQFLSSKS